MAFTYPIHADDECVLKELMAQLGTHMEAQGLTFKELEARMGVHEEYVRHLESGRHTSARLSRYQLWAQALGFRLEFGLENFWMHSWSDQEMLAFYAMSRRWGAGDMLRLWLVSALRVWRVRGGVSDARLGARLGMTGDGVARWERDAHDPFLRRVMWQARETGTAVTLHLWRSEDWTFQ